GVRSEGWDDDAQMAFHGGAAGEGAAALRYAPAAARRAAALASHREAAAQFERALRFADEADPATAARLHDDFAYEASLLDRWQEAVGAHGRALALWRDVGDRLREGNTLRWLAYSLCSLSRGEAAVAAAQDAIALLEPLGPTAELAWAYANLAAMWMVRGANGDAIALGRRAQAIAWPLGLTKVLSNALNSEACAVRAAGGTWAGTLRESLDIALTGRHEAEVARAYVNLHACYVADRDWAAAERDFTKGIAYCDDHDFTPWSIFMRSERTSALQRTGRWDEAVALCCELLHQGGPSPNIRLSPLHRLGTIQASRGEPGAMGCLDEAIKYADGAGEPQSIVPVRLARAEAFWLEGTLADARREAELADDAADGCDEWDRGAVAVWLRCTGSARPPRGELAAPYQRQLDGDPAGAACLWTDLGCPYEAGLALLGSTDETSLRQALWIFIRLGASATARLTRKKMRQLSIRSIPAGPRTATRKHPLGLTRREREVLELICARHTNAEIAQKLFISVKTVDHHVSAVLAKLGAPTRRAAASRGAQPWLVHPAPVNSGPAGGPPPAGAGPAGRCRRTAAWRPSPPAGQPGRVTRSSCPSVPGSPSRSIAVIFPSVRVKVKTTRGRPPTAHTAPATPLMSASLAALARPRNMAATAATPRISGSAPVRTTAWSARTPTPGSRTATSAPRSPLREAARKACTTSRRRVRSASGAVSAPWIRRRARLASCRVAAGERSTIGAISSKGMANMSCRTNASRSAGVSVSRTTS